MHSKLRQSGQRLVSNVVFMGEGEPLYNHRAVAEACRILTDPEGMDIPKRRVTISTSGVAPAIAKIGLLSFSFSVYSVSVLIIHCLADLGVQLALSLHAPNDTLRSRIMSINNTYNS